MYLMICTRTYVKTSQARLPVGSGHMGKATGRQCTPSDSWALTSSALSSCSGTASVPSLRDRASLGKTIRAKGGRDARKPLLRDARLYTINRRYIEPSLNAASVKRTETSLTCVASRVPDTEAVEDIMIKTLELEVLLVVQLAKPTPKDPWRHCLCAFLHAFLERVFASLLFYKSH